MCRVGRQTLHTHSLSIGLLVAISSVADNLYYIRVLPRVVGRSQSRPVSQSAASQSSAAKCFDVAHKSDGQAW